MNEVGILVVDDDYGVRVAIRAIFGPDHRINVIGAEDLETAKKALREHPIRLVLLDRDLGKECGSDLFPTLKRLVPRHLQVVLISGDNNWMLRAAKEAGVVIAGQCQKPFDVDVLMQCVYSTLELSPADEDDEE